MNEILEFLIEEKAKELKKLTMQHEKMSVKIKATKAAINYLNSINNQNK